MIYLRVHGSWNNPLRSPEPLLNSAGDWNRRAFVYHFIVITSICFSTNARYCTGKFCRENSVCTCVPVHQQFFFLRDTFAWALRKALNPFKLRVYPPAYIPTDKIISLHVLLLLRLLYSSSLSPFFFNDHKTFSFRNAANSRTIQEIDLRPEALSVVERRTRRPWICIRKKRVY